MFSVHREGSTSIDSLLGVLYSVLVIAPSAESTLPLIGATPHAMFRVTPAAGLSCQPALPEPGPQSRVLPHRSLAWGGRILLSQQECAQPTMSSAGRRRVGVGALSYVQPEPVDIGVACPSKHKSPCRCLLRRLPWEAAALPSLS